MKAVRYYVKHVNTVNAHAKFRAPADMMAKVTKFFADQKSVSVLLLQLFQKCSVISNGKKINVWKKGSEKVTFDYSGNPLEFSNGSFIASDGGGWYTAWGNDDVPNSCFFALNAVIGKLFQLINPKQYQPNNKRRYTVAVDIEKHRVIPSAESRQPNNRVKWSIDDLVHKYEKTPVSV